MNERIVQSDSGATPSPRRQFKTIFLRGLLRVMIIVAIIVAVLAFASLWNSNLKLNALVSEISAYIDTTGLTSDIEQAGKAFIERLEVYGQNAMESSTISFLVTILSAGVIGFGVYLVDRAHRDIQVVEDRIREQSEKSRSINVMTSQIIEANSIVWVISIQLSNAKIMSQRLKSAHVEQNIVDALIPDLRELLCSIREELYKINEKSPVDLWQLRYFCNQTMDIKLNLSTEMPQDLIDLCDELKKYLDRLIERIGESSQD